MTKIIWEPPALEHDKMMLERFNHAVIPRGKLERRVLWNLLSQLEEHGFQAFAVDDDGEERTKCDSIKDVMELVFNLDEAHIFCEHPSGKSRHWIFVVMGNDGWDLVSDYGSPEVDTDGFRAILDGFDGEDFV